MKNLFIFLIPAIIVLGSCKSGESTNNSELATHKVEVKEIVQANAYTYLNVVENKKDQWIAVSKMEAKVGDIFYFDEFVEMNDFKSKDLDRTFASVYFIQELRSEADPHAGHDHAGHDHAMHGGMPANHPQTGQKHEGKPGAAKKEISVEPVEGGISLAELFANRTAYDSKKVLVKGEVVKANFEIMNKNWFHIQDGTSDGDNYDLTVTSLETNIKVGDIITFEGEIVLNNDFGYGYSYEVLMENAVIK